MNQNPEAALRELRQAHEMNPNRAVTMVWLALYEGFRGDVEKGVPLVEARLAGRWLASNPAYLARAHLFFRIASGLAPPEPSHARSMRPEY